MAPPNRRAADADAGMLVNLSIAANADITGQSLPVIPSGVVYGSSNRQPLAGATVRVTGPAGFDPARHLVGGADNAEQRSSDEGMYQFLLTSGAPAAAIGCKRSLGRLRVPVRRLAAPARRPGPARRLGRWRCSRKSPAAARRGHDHPVHGIARQPARGQQPPAAGPGRDPGPAAAQERVQDRCRNRGLRGLRAGTEQPDGRTAGRRDLRRPARRRIRVSGRLGARHHRRRRQRRRALTPNGRAACPCDSTCRLCAWPTRKCCA